MLEASATSAISILHSLGILALMATGIAMLQPSRLSDAPGWRRSLVMGAAFGATIVFAMADPMVLPPGATFDARGGPAMLAGLYGGPVVAAVAAVMGSAMRWWLGGAGAPGGLVGFVLYAAVGLAARWYFARRARRPSLAELFGLAVFGTLCVVPSFFVYPDWRIGVSILSRAWWVVLTGNVVGVLVLGTLLEQDWRRRRLEQDLRETEARTRTAAEAKTRFLASMSHEIRTPMNAVLGFVDLLRDSKLDSFQRRCADQIRDGATGLLRVIDDILDYAKIDAGRVTIHPQPTDVPDLVETCREMLMPQIEAKGIACTLDLPDDAPSVDVDPIRLRQVLLNLMGNAVKFTDAGRVALTVRQVAGSEPGRAELTISVADTGIGMSPEERDRLFSPFAQGDHIGRGGTGLGLVICRMLVAAMGGELTLTSGLGVGTTVTIRIPVTVSSDAVADALSPDAPSAASPAVSPTADTATALRILIAEDVALNAEMLQATLKQAGHDVRIVPDGLQAVEALRNEPFDIVLMDIQMPVMDGLAATREIRALDGPVAATPIVALTAYASRDDLKRCLDAGMNDFLTKPLERSKLRQVLQRWGSAANGPAAAALPPEPATDTAPPAAAPPVAAPAVADSDETYDRVGELLARLSETDRNDRESVRSMADGLVTAAGGIGFNALAERARRLVAASPRSNAEAIGALIEDVVEGGRRTLDAARQDARRDARGEGR